jgi:hypothetical protein
VISQRDLFGLVRVAHFSECCRSAQSVYKLPGRGPLSGRLWRLLSKRNLKGTVIQSVKRGLHSERASRKRPVRMSRCQMEGGCNGVQSGHVFYQQRPGTETRKQWPHSGGAQGSSKKSLTKRPLVLCFHDVFRASFKPQADRGVVVEEDSVAVPPLSSARAIDRAGRWALRRAQSVESAKTNTSTRQEGKSRDHFKSRRSPSPPERT